ncbi:AzlD family protein [Roseibium aestuarii]|uniref:AzlD family protein n=1 Tax=Roseibium aestuarii TaxID=2600299 RepID=A0ABW4JVT0_9HYPH|nr:AzlD domain-containing protein [Roseibium aestuarii]
MTDAAFSADLLFVLAVAMMTGVTYFMRAGGYWLMGRLPLTDRVRRGLEALPGAIIISTILPIVLKGDLALGLSLLSAIAVMALLRKDFIAVAAAVVTAALLRSAGI